MKEVIMSAIDNLKKKVQELNDLIKNAVDNDLRVDVSTEAIPNSENDKAYPVIYVDLYKKL